jgi:hypothetical protein
MQIECNKAGIVTNEPSDTTSNASGGEMSEVAKGKQRQVDTPESTENPTTPASETSSIVQGKRKQIDMPETAGVEPVQRVRTIHMLLYTNHHSAFFIGSSALNSTGSGWRYLHTPKISVFCPKSAAT